MPFADSGEIFIEGQNILDPDCDINPVRAEVGMVFQSFNLFPHLSVIDNAMLAQQTVRGRPKEEARKKAWPWPNKVGIGDKHHVFLDQLSGHRPLVGHGPESHAL